MHPSICIYCGDPIVSMGATVSAPDISGKLQNFEADIKSYLNDCPLETPGCYVPSCLHFQGLNNFVFEIMSI